MIGYARGRRFPPKQRHSLMSDWVVDVSGVCVNHVCFGVFPQTLYKACHVGWSNVGFWFGWTGQLNA